MATRSNIDWWARSGSAEGSTHDRGRRMLETLLDMDVAEFERDFWLKKPLLRRHGPGRIPPGHPSNMMPLADVKALLRRRHPRPARFLHDVDVTKYVNGQRKALSDGNGEADPDSVLAAFERDGYSIRIVHPQQWHQACYELCSVLQEHFGFPVGCSAYLTPRASQGFPPHYDDVEVFVLQLEGSKRWRLYDRPDGRACPAADRTTEFAREDLGEPLQTLTLHAGDLLYLPRGVVHQALAQADGHSLHLTFSTYQRHTWRELLVSDEGLALSRRAREALAAICHARAPSPTVAVPGGGGEGGVEGGGEGGVEGGVKSRARPDDAGTDTAVLRGDGLLRDLPIDLLHTHTAGAPCSGWERCAAHLTPPHVPFWLSSELSTDGVLGGALDALALRFLQHSLPPLGSLGSEASRHGQGEPPRAPLPLTGHSRVRMYAPHCARLVDTARTGGDWASWEAATDPEPPSLELHHNLMNGRSFAEPPSPAFEVLPSLARSVVQLLSSGGTGVRVAELAAFRAGDAATRDDLIDLLALCEEYGVVTRADGDTARSGGDEAVPGLPGRPRPLQATPAGGVVASGGKRRKKRAREQGK